MKVPTFVNLSTYVIVIRPKTSFMTHPLINQHCNIYNIFSREDIRVINWFVDRSGLTSAISLLKWPICDDWALFSIWTAGWNFIHTIRGRDLYFSGIYQKYNFNSKFIKSENFYIKNSEETISLNWRPPKVLNWSNWSTWSMTSVTSFWTTWFQISSDQKEFNSRVPVLFSCSYFAFILF